MSKSVSKILLGKPEPKPRTRPKAAAVMVKMVLKPAAPRTRALPRSSIAALPGKWLASSHSLLPEGLPLSAPRLNYWLYLPAKELPEAFRAKGRPLVVMLHGCEQTATQFAQGTRMNKLAERKGFAVLYPQQSLASHSQRCWKWYDKATQHGGGDVRLIAGLIEKVAAAYPIDRSRIYICGISAGAGMANIVALNHPQLIAAVGLHSGPVFGAGHGPLGALGVMQHGASQRADGAIAEVLAHRPGFPQMPAILIQGQGDRVVRPINQTHLVRQSLLLNRAPADTSVSVALKPGGRPGSRNPANAHQIRDFYVGKKLLLRVAQIERLEHAWSGGDESLSFNTRAGPDASKMMLDFFSKHRRLA
ncbi:MAG TPA: PHB depolymerase family esterase [Janthinobacterium sp.]|nr:PHB depolymerase family esterase [Janthinobacterium sp.]